MAYRILVVDDEEDIRDILEFNLQQRGYLVDCASSAEEALKALSPAHNLIILDVMMSGMSGFEMASKLRNIERNPIPIIFLTAKSSEEDLLTGFSSGGDDYIPKPFSINELLARVAAILKRSNLTQQTSSLDKLRVANLLLDMSSRMLYISDEPVTLSKKEFEILELLMKHAGTIYSREDIISELWKDAPYVLPRTVDVHIARIRSKFGKYKNYIVNRSGWGYTFNPSLDESQKS